MGTFVFRWPHAASNVYVTGTFDDWGKTEKLEKVGDVFEKEVTLPSANEKYYYKFVVDELWTTDHEAPQEDDGHYNVNNILMPEQVKREKTTMPEANSSGSTGPTGTSSAFSQHGSAGRTEGPSSGFNEHSVAAATGLAAAGGAGAAMLSSVTPQSTTAGLAGQVPKEDEKDAGAATISSVTPQSTTAGLAGSVPKEDDEDGDKMGGNNFSGDKRATAVPSAREPSNSPPGAFPEEPANETQDFGVKPIPASEGTGNPVSVPAGEKVPEPNTINSNTIDSTATTSKEGYEKDASAAFPVVAAAAGVGVASAAGAGAYAHEKRSGADSFGVNPIPASSGISNPISVPAGEKLPEQNSFNPNTVQSTATTSKEGYEKDADAPLVAPAGIAGATGAGTGAATGSAFSVPERSKNMIPESSLPMGGEAKDTMDTGPTISSAAPSSSSAILASTVPLEPKRQGMVIDEDEAPSATLSGPAPTVPEMVKESMSEAHFDPEATGSAEVVGEKALMENELLKKVKSTDAVGEPAPSPAAQGVSTAPVSSVASNVPAMVKESISQAHHPAEAAAAPEVVDEKREMEGELLREVRSTDAAGEPAPSLSAKDTSAAPMSSVASNVPAIVKRSISQADQPAEAAAAPEVVNEKRDMEGELLREVKSSDAVGEPAPTAAAATTDTASKATEAASSGGIAGATTLVSPTAKSDAPTHAAPFEPTTPGVETLHPAPNASLEKPQAPAKTDPSTKSATKREERDLSPMSPDPNAPATPAKTTTTDNTPKTTPGPAATGATSTPSSTTSPASTATKDQKKKNRRSFFGKLRDRLKDL